MRDKKFNILTIDGGGIRGVFPGKFLADLENLISEKNLDKKRIYEHFDLICGTSTGGILAISLALGIPANEILDLYLTRAKEIFGAKRQWFKRLTYYSKYDIENLKINIRDKFRNYFNGNDPRLIDVKTAVCVPIYDLLEGRPSVLKSNYHPRFNRDYHIPAYIAALSTAAAPTYFDPVSETYEKIKSDSIENFSNKIDGGVFANNPTILAIIEAQKAFNVDLKNIQILSIGTGKMKYSDAKDRKHWGPLYWLNFKRRRIIDLFMQSQSQHVSNLISLLQKGIDKTENPNFEYIRIDTEFDSEFNLSLDETNKELLNKLSKKASKQFQDHGSEVFEKFCKAGL